MGHFYECPECGHEKCICPHCNICSSKPCVCIKSGETVSTPDPIPVGRVVPAQGMAPIHKGERDVRRVPRKFDSLTVEHTGELPHGPEPHGQPFVPTDEILGQGTDGGGLRMDGGKIRFDLLPPEWDQALADVCTQGMKKYDARNWEKGMEWSAMVGCIKRHMNKFLAGERYDGAEFDLEKGTTGCHHLAMAAWNILALMTYDLREIGDNNLPKEVTLQLLDRLNAVTSDMGNEINEI